MTTRADYLDFDTLLTEEQRLVRDTVGENVWKSLIDPADGMILPADVFKR